MFTFYLFIISIGDLADSLAKSGHDEDIYVILGTCHHQHISIIK